MKNKSQYCPYCDYTGMIYNPAFDTMGENALSPCPKCVVPQCRCGGEEPYYYSEDDRIITCHCRETRMKIDKVLRKYYSSGIDK